jgi:hypothetical protein
MRTHPSRLLIALPILAATVAIAVGPLTSTASELTDHVVEGLELDRRVDAARDTVEELVHAGASRVAEKTEGPGRAVHPKPRRLLRTERRVHRDASSTAPTPKPDSLPARTLGDQTIPDFAELQGKDRAGQAHSGRLPPRL